jgi:hypothetical protein
MTKKKLTSKEILEYRKKAKILCYAIRTTDKEAATRFDLGVETVRKYRLELVDSQAMQDFYQEAKHQQLEDWYVTNNEILDNVAEKIQGKLANPEKLALQELMEAYNVLANYAQMHGIVKSKMEKHQPAGDKYQPNDVAIEKINTEDIRDMDHAIEEFAGMMNTESEPMDRVESDELPPSEKEE